MRTRLHRGAGAWLLAALWLAGGDARAVNGYLNPSNINLVTIRGTVASASQWDGVNSYRAPLHGGYGWEYRSGSYPGSGSIWWQAQLPGIYWVSNWVIQFYSAPYGVTNFTIQTSLNGTLWDTQAVISDSSIPSRRFAGSFPAVQAKYIRVDGTAFDTPSFGMILQQVRFTGPNAGLPLSLDISVAQSTWNGGAASGAGWGDVAQAIDDGVVANWNFGCVYSSTNGPGLIVTLPLPYTLGRVAMTGFTDNRCPRDVDVYASQLASGDTDWALVCQIRDFVRTDGLGTSVYQEFPLPSLPERVRRLRFDTLRNWGHGSQTYLNEIYAYPIPPARGTVITIR